MVRCGCRGTALLNRNSPSPGEEQVQAAVDCFNAGATTLHIHVHDPKTGHISKNFNQYNDQVGRLRNAVPKMILQLGGSISFVPEPGEEAKFQSYDSRHKLAEVNPKRDANYLFRFTKDASFVNKNEFRRKLRQLPEGSKLLVDGTRALFIDHDILEILDDFRQMARHKNIEIEVKHWESYQPSR